MRRIGSLSARALIYSLAACAAATLTACGGGGGSAGGTGGTQGGAGAALTPQARAAVLDQVVAKFGTLPGTDANADNQAMLQYLQGRPEFTSAKVEDGSVWATFTDGQLLVVFNNRKFDPSAKAMTVTTSRGQPVDVPTARQVQCVDTFDPAAAGRTAAIMSLLTGNGYISAGSDGTVDGLKAVGADGVFYIDAHGTVNTPSGGTPELWLTTNTPYSAANIAKYDADFKAGRVAYGVVEQTARNPDGTVGTKQVPTGNLIISSAFVKKYWSFSPNSLVFINACSSDTADFKSACISKGAGLYLGWTQPVIDGNAAKAGSYLIDRLIGANRKQPESPPQRPFDYAKIQGDMHSKGLDTDGTANLVFTPGSGTFGLLAPTIQYVSVDEQKKELTLAGTFGTDQSTAKVTVGGTEVAIKQWGFNVVICDLPPDTAGDVVVTVQDHKSNAVPLTQWTGDITYTQTDSKSSFEVQFKTHVEFRADVHGFRDKPAVSPIFGTTPFDAEQQVSTSSYSGTGTYCGPNGCGSLMGSGDLPLQFVGQGQPGAGSGEYFFFNGSIDAQKMQVNVNFQAQEMTGMQYVPDPDHPAYVPITILPAVFWLSNPPPPNASLIWTLNLDDKFNIADGQLQKVFQGNGGSGTLKLEWHFTTQSAPDPAKGEDDSAPQRRVARSRGSRRAIAGSAASIPQSWIDLPPSCHRALLGGRLALDSGAVGGPRLGARRGNSLATAPIRRDCVRPNRLLVACIAKQGYEQAVMNRR